MLDLNHDQALWWNRGAGFGAVPEFIEALDIRSRKFAAAHVQKRSTHLARHLTQERPAANGKNQFFVIRSARQLSRVDFALSGAFFIVVFGTRGSGKGGKVVHANEPRRRVAHGVFVQREWVVENVTPNCGRHDFSAIEAIAVGLAARGPAGIAIRADLFVARDSNRWTKQRVQRALKFLRRKSGLRSKAGHLSEYVHASIGAASAVQYYFFLRELVEHADDFPPNLRLVRLALPSRAL